MTVLENSALDAVDGDVTKLDPSSGDHAPETDGERAGMYLAALIALAVPSIIVLAFFLPNGATTQREAPVSNPVVEEPSAGLDSTEVPAEVVVAEVDGAIESADSGDVVSTAAEPTGEAASTAPTVEAEDRDAAPIDLNAIDPESIDIFVYDETPAENGDVTFALRLKSVATSVEIDTNVFSVELQSSDGAPAPTSVRFVHDTLPVGSSALATVRSTNLGSETSVVVVSMGGREIGRVPFNLN